MKKATPKVVFDACEQLALLDRAWNRDDVRLLVGGGSFSVIDPLIQAWRKLQPVREVAPSVPSDLLIQVATMLEQQISDYVEQVEQRDQERERALLEMNDAVSANLQHVESQLTDKLDQSQQANHALEAELSRIESELDEKKQALQVTSLKLEVSEEAVESLNTRLKEQKALYEVTLVQQKQRHQDEVIRIGELHQQQSSEQKLELKQQMAQQKAELLSAAQLTEDRLMRLLDQGRSEIKEQNADSSHKIDTLSRELQAEKQLSNTQRLEIKALTLSHEAKLSEINKAAQGVQQRVTDSESLVSILNNENGELKSQLLEYKERGSQQEKSDLQQLKDSIRLLQEQVQGK
jgi:ABC-type transporter Mla subunit MlaD